MRTLSVIRRLVVVFPLGALAMLARPASAQAPAPAAPAEAADSADAPPPKPVRQSWVSDRRSFVVGDIITVNIDEYTLASANSGNSATDNRRRTADFGVNAKMPAGTSMGGTVGYSGTNNADLTQRGEATRQNRFTSEMTVRVKEVSANGVLKVEGKKLVTIDGAKQEVALSGFVRPQDVGSANQIDSQRIGEMTLDYKNSGDLGKPKNGLFWKLFGWLFP
jgi:flagellar L-ring protein precursor FlgH